jgi:hypothetical protein
MPEVYRGRKSPRKYSKGRKSPRYSRGRNRFRGVTYRASQPPSNIGEIHDFTRQLEDGADDMLTDHDIDDAVEAIDLLAKEREINLHFTEDEIRDAFKNIVSSRRTWTGEEDQLLLELHNRHGKHWEIIAQSIPAKSASACRNRVGKLKGV